MNNAHLDIRKEIIDACKRIYSRGYVASNDGNVSVKVDESNILITPTGVSKGFVDVDDLIIVSLDGVLISGEKKPSSEMEMHIQLYKNRRDIKSVCHAHPPYATGFAVAGIPLDKCILPEVVISLGSIPLIEYGTPGTNEIYEPILKKIKDHDAFLLANHGAVTVGTSITSAYHKMETLEHFAQIYFISQQLGNTNILNRQQSDKLIELRNEFGITLNAGCVSCKEN